MDRNPLWFPPLREEGRVTRGCISCRTYNSSIVLLSSLLLCLTTWLSLSAGCSSVPSSVAALVTGEAPTDQTYAGRQHLPVTPDEALECLIDVAPQQGWAVVNTGKEYNTQGQRGTFFRLATTALSGSKQTVSGVFYAEPSGSYVRISEQNGLPETLVEPLITEVKKKKGYR
jgi:hypothetical protein